jgi:hypothetical protein
MENFIQLNKDDVLRLEIRTDDGKSTGEFLEFDLEDIELPLKYQEMSEMEKRNQQNLKNQFLIIDKRQDVKGKKLLSKNEEDKIKALNDFFKKEEEIYDMFLGKGGVRKLLNGRKMGWTSLKNIDEIIKKQIMPHFDLSMERITNKVKEKYSQSKNKDKEVLE